MDRRVGAPLSPTSKVALASAMATLVALPLLSGAMLAAQADSSANSSQGPASLLAEPRFDVASVKRSLPTGSGRVAPGVTQPGGRWIVQNAPLRMILRTIYPDYRMGRIVGGPAWLDTQPFDIDARAQPDASPEAIMLMARALLAERFGLRFRIEPREVEVLALVSARSDGRPGSGLGPAAECQSDESPGSHGVFSGVAPQPGELPPCELLSRVEGAARHVTARAVPISSLVSFIQMVVNVENMQSPLQVIDRTNLTGLFAIDLIIEQPAAPDRLTPSPSSQALAAIEEQLGLVVRRQRETVDVLVVEEVQMPDPD